MVKNLFFGGWTNPGLSMVNVTSCSGDGQVELQRGGEMCGARSAGWRKDATGTLRQRERSDEKVHLGWLRNIFWLTNWYWCSNPFFCSLRNISKCCCFRQTASYINKISTPIIGPSSFVFQTGVLGFRWYRYLWTQPWKLPTVSTWLPLPYWDPSVQYSDHSTHMEQINDKHEAVVNRWLPSTLNRRVGACANPGISSMWTMMNQDEQV